MEDQKSCCISVKCCIIQQKCVFFKNIYGYAYDRFTLLKYEKYYEIRRYHLFLCQLRKVQFLVVYRGVNCQPKKPTDYPLSFDEKKVTVKLSQTITNYQPIPAHRCARFLKTHKKSNFSNMILNRYG